MLLSLAICVMIGICCGLFQRLLLMVCVLLAILVLRIAVLAAGDAGGWHIFLSALIVVFGIQFGYVVGLLLRAFVPALSDETHDPARPYTAGAAASGLKLGDLTRSFRRRHGADRSDQSSGAAEGASKAEATRPQRH